MTKPYETVLETAVELTHDEINTLRNYPDIQSAGASIQNILLTAVDMGYGACWLSGPMFARQEIEQMLNVQISRKASRLCCDRPFEVGTQTQGKAKPGGFAGSN